jgi:uncharacterized protein YndB with AHSA1/START domain
VNDIKQKAGSADTAGDFLITKIVDAPRERVWKAWTEPKQLEQWWGPKGFKAKVIKLDLKPGGMFLYRLSSPEGEEIWGKFIYKEIAPPERLVFIVSFSDADAGMTRHPMRPDWPLEIMSTVSLTETADGKTAVTVRWTPHEATQKERDNFEEGRESMKHGWAGTFELLVEYLSKG